MERAFQQTTQAVALLSASAFVLSVVFQWGYFTPLDLHLLTLLTVQDYVVGAALFLTPLGFGMAFGVWSGIITGLSNLDKVPVFSKLKWRIDISLYILSIILALLFFLFLPQRYIIFYMVSVFFVNIGLLFSIEKTRFFKEFISLSMSRITFVVFAVLSPMFIVLVFMLGVGASYSEMDTSPNITMLKVGAAAVERPIVLFRRIDRGYLYENPKENRLFFLSDNGEIQLSIEVTAPSVNSLSCVLFGWPCMFSTTKF